MLVNIKKLHPDAVIPTYANSTDAGMDLTAVTVEYDENHEVVTYGIGLSLEIPEGYVGLLFARSSVFKTRLSLANCVGVIDSGYRGEIKFKFYLGFLNKLVLKLASTFGRSTKLSYPYDIMDRVGQIIILPYPKIEFAEKEILSDSDRGEGGFGSTGK